MVCPSCGNQVPRDSRFCDNCGAQLAGAPAPAPTPYRAPAPAPAASNPYDYRPTPSGYGAPPKKKRRWLLPLIIGLVVLAAAAVFLLWFFGDARAYNQAQTLYEEGQFAQAEQSFRALGDYKDSADRVDDCRYHQAKTNFDKGNYALAKTQFEALGSYSDSAEQVKACSYQQARQAFAKGDLEGAAVIFEALGSYSDSADWLEKCRPGPEGTWLGQVNLGEAAGDYLGDMQAYFSDMDVNFVLELRKDGTFNLSIDTDAMLPMLKEGFRAYVNDMLRDMGYTAADFESLTGQSVDDLIDETLAELDLEDLAKTASGTYTENDGTLILTPGEGLSPIRGTWSGDSLTLYDDELGAIRFSRS